MLLELAKEQSAKYEALQAQSLAAKASAAPVLPPPLQPFSDAQFRPASIGSPVPVRTPHGSPVGSFAECPLGFVQVGGLTRPLL